MLSKLDKKNLKTLKELFAKEKLINLSDDDQQLMSGLLSLLEANNVVRPIHMDNANAYLLVGSFDIFEKVLKDAEAEEAREKRSDRWHDFWMVVWGAVLGGVVTVCLYKFLGIG